MPSRSDDARPQPPPRFSPAPRRASERVAREIRRYVQVNGLTPGDRLGTEQELAREFGISRPTMREALRLLSSSHLIRNTQGPGGGVFVASTPNEGMGQSVSESIALMLATDGIALDQLLDTRMLLEVPLTGLAAKRIDEAGIERLRAALEAGGGEDPGSDEFRVADMEFHRQIAAAAGNELALALTSWVFDVFQPSLVDEVGAVIDGEKILDQHRAIFRALERSQSAAAERAMAAHLQYVRGVVEILAAGKAQLGR